MALPKLNDVPYYSVEIPSTGVKTRYRPYLVKEEKILLIALESGDLKQISDATVDLIRNCLEDDIDVSSLSVFDIEYLFVKIRTKSVGETVNLNFLCSDCDSENEVTVNLEEVSVPTYTKDKRTITLTKDISVEMKYLSYRESNENEQIASPTSYAEYMFESILRSMHTVNTEEESILVKDESDESKIEFLNSLTTDQFNKLRTFIESSPAVSCTVDFKCSECEKENSYTLKGLNDFFG